MYGGTSQLAAMIPELAARPLAWAVTGIAALLTVGTLAVVRGLSKMQQKRRGGDR